MASYGRSVCDDFATAVSVDVPPFLSDGGSLRIASYQPCLSDNNIAPAALTAHEMQLHPLEWLVDLVARDWLADRDHHGRR